jgi:uncharacterized membrane protein YhhN
MRFTYFFIGLLFMELIAVSIDSKPLEFLFKPALMLALGIYFYQQTVEISNNKQRNRILLGTFFSLIGDILLMFSGGFIFGLAAFLMAHLFYISAFYLDNEGFIFKKKDRFLAATGILAYGVVFLSIVLPKVGNALLFPVSAYGITILIMLLTALNRWKNAEKTSFQWVLTGAIIFVISDSLLAINRFVQPFPFSGIGIMLTYATGQFLIINGILKKLKMN